MYLHHCSLITTTFDRLRENRSHKHGSHGTRAWVKKRKILHHFRQAIWYQKCVSSHQKKFKIGTLGDFEKIQFVAIFLMRKRLSSGQKRFLRPYFPLIRGMFVFRSGVRFFLGTRSPRVRKRRF